MRRVSMRTLWGMIIAVFVLAMIPAQFSMAAVAKPDRVKKLTAKDVTSSSATLTWSKVSNADGYLIYRINPTTNKKKQIATTTALTYPVTIPKSGKKYSYQVYAIRKNGSKYIKSAKGSPTVDVKPQMLRKVCYGNKCVFLEWDKVPNAKSYILYRYDADDDTYTVIKKLTATNYKVTGLAVGKKYRFAVRSVSKSGKKSDYSNILTVKGKKLTAVRGRCWTATVKVKKLKAKEEKTGKKVTLKYGDLVYTSACTSGPVMATLKNGKRVLVQGSSLKYGNLRLTKSYDYYSKNQAEAFVNGGGYTSKTDWLIWISQYTASVHFFKGSQGQWKRQLVVPCVIGLNGHTKPGEYEILRFEGSHIYFYWNEARNWGQSFHERIDSNWRGALSSGCIRLGYPELRYLRTNCEVGTAVISN